MKYFNYALSSLILTIGLVSGAYADGGIKTKATNSQLTFSSIPSHENEEKQKCKDGNMSSECTEVSKFKSTLAASDDLPEEPCPDGSDLPECLDDVATEYHLLSSL
ncbi:hypothetical protein BIY22_03565 [Vibrio panuliri]|uniref:Secreted protein n=1 Tax=Vibrio panuliri TaxID=1381081 RepID=A0A1Q9HIG1_9VIBR|nr:hypothetical protein [Vibrio panuliri]OLQ90096.1 hypothetical protein BIY22_03565 [Vibrio panuliri]